MKDRFEDMKDFYEMPKYDGELGSPSVFEPVDDAARSRKVKLLMDGFGTQLGKKRSTAETFLELMRLRGFECESATGHTAFYVGKVVLAPGVSSA